MRPVVVRARRLFLTWLICAAAAAVISAPVAVEQAIEQASVDDRLGSLPVQVRLAHDGVTTLDTGILGEVYWRRTGVAGFGAEIRSTGPPLAGGTLASYVSPAFVQANARFVEDPGQLAAVYGAELRQQVVVRSVRYLVGAGVVGGVLCLVLARGAPLLPREWHRRRRLAVGGGMIVAGLVASTGVAAFAFVRWSGDDPTAEAYTLPGRPEVLFSSPQTREVAEQVQPFIQKNMDRIAERAREYQAAATVSINDQLEAHGSSLRPRDGEEIVVAEADPQGSRVGTRVRRVLYAALEDQLGEGAVVLRTIAGDVTSNGTLAEADFVRSEATASPNFPVVAAKGDHDTPTTVDQLIGDGVPVPDTETIDAGGLRVASARDPEFKALFGGLVLNDTDLSEADIGAALREAIDPSESLVVMLHQPRAVEAYVGAGRATWMGDASLTTPHDDGIPDLPPGVVTYGHLHDPAGPWVVWNTDGGQLTWTVITQLGTSGGVDENPTFNHFSTPFSVPLKPISVQLQYLNATSGLQTGYAEISIATDGTVTIGDRVDVGLPGGMPRPLATP